MADKKPKAWSEIAADPKFQALPADARYNLRSEYFDRIVAPNVPDDKREQARAEFFDKTHGKTFGTLDEIGLAVGDMGRIISNGATFNLADKAVAAGRAAFDGELDYDTALKQERAMTDTARERAGWAGTAGDLVGGAMLGNVAAKNGLSLVGSKAVEKAGLTTKMLAGAVEGGAYGAGYAVGGDDSGDWTQKATAAGVGGVGGAAAGALAAPITSGLTGLMQKILGKGSAKMQLDGDTMTPRSQYYAERALEGARGDKTLAKLDGLGPDAMALNASPDVKAFAYNAVTRGGDGGELVADKLMAQMGKRSDRLKAITNDALGPVGRDTDLIKEGLDEGKALLNQTYGPLLRGTKVEPHQRIGIVRTATKAGQDFASGTPIRDLFNRFSNLKNLPADGMKLKNLVWSEVGKALKKHPEAAPQLYALKQAAADALGGATDGEFTKLQRAFHDNRSSKEAVQRAEKFFDDAVNPRHISADMANNSGRAPLMREASRATVDKLMRSKGNEISKIQNLVGRTTNNMNADKIDRVFGAGARQKLASGVEKEVAKSQDFADILRNSNTASKQAAQLIEKDGLYIPEARTARGMGSELLAIAVDKIRSLAVGRDNEKTRMLLAKVATMGTSELRDFIKELNRAGSVSKAKALGAARGVAAVEAAGNGAKGR